MKYMYSSHFPETLVQLLKIRRLSLLLREIQASENNFSANLLAVSASTEKNNLLKNHEDEGVSLRELAHVVFTC